MTPEHVSRESSVMLSAAKHLCAHPHRSFAQDDTVQQLREAFHCLTMPKKSEERREALPTKLSSSPRQLSHNLLPGFRVDPRQSFTQPRGITPCIQQSNNSLQQRH